ncbi:MAG: hypothetical protein ACFFC1_20315 [Promethearchaeota archaeon]
MKINEKAITLTVAVIGAVLGLVNSYWILTSDTVDLSIQPSPVLKREGNILMTPRDLREFEYGINHYGAPKEIFMKITNTGRVTAWVTGIGFTNKNKKNRFYLLSPDLETKGGFPLGPKEPRNIDTKVTPELRKHLISGVDQAFVETSDGKVFLGSTPIWDNYVQWLKKSNNANATDS